MLAAFLLFCVTITTTTLISQEAPVVSYNKKLHMVETH